MRDIEVSTDPADYLYGPTTADAARGSGGTNQTGGVSVVDEDELPTVTPSQPEQDTGQQPPTGQ